MKKRLLGLALGVISPCLLMAAEPVALSDFQVEPETTGWTFREVKPEKTENGWRLTYPKWRQGQEEWPAAILNAGDGLATTDWSKEQYLAFRLFNESAAFTISLRLDDAEQRQYIAQFPLPAGEETLCLVKIADLKKSGLAVERMASWNLWLTRPPEERRVVLSNLVLTDDPYTAADWRRKCDAAAEQVAAAETELKKQPDSAFRKARLAQLADWRQLLEAPDRRSAQQEWFDTVAPINLASLAAAAQFFAARPQECSVSALPSTLKLRQDQFPAETMILPALQLDAARGEGESLQLLVAAGGEALDGIKVAVSALRDETGNEIEPKLYLLGYVPVSKPTPAPNGFGEKERYPDPLCPNEPFRLAAFANQALLLTVRVPETAEPGDYRGTVSVECGGRTETLPVALKVYPVTVPKNGRLKTCWIYRNEGRDPRYYGANWTKEMELAFLRQNLEYRFDAEEFGSSIVLPWDSVFTVDENGKVSADWSGWDRAVETWRAAGKNTFLGYYPGWITAMPELKEPEIEAQKLQLTSRHLAEKGWENDFYMYIFDEPAPADADRIKEVCRWIHRQGTNLNILLTSCHDNEQAYRDDIDIFVPHANIFDAEFGEECRRNGKQYWQYTCIGTVGTRYPDSWKIDFYGTGHRALGWWLFKYGSQGYLYWGLDYWRVNPWEDTETFPNGNGDGSMFYPAPDGKSLPYPSLRAELVRDGFEDYELLSLLAKRYADSREPEIRNLLEAEEIIYEPDRYNETGDRALLEQHRRLLEWLSK